MIIVIVTKFLLILLWNDFFLFAFFLTWKTLRGIEIRRLGKAKQELPVGEGQEYLEGMPCPRKAARARERERERTGQKVKGAGRRETLWGKKKEQVGGVARAVRGHGGGEAVGPTWSWRVTEVADPRLGSGLGISFFKGEVSVSIGRDAAAPWQKVNQPPPDSVGLGSPIIPWL